MHWPSATRGSESRGAALHASEEKSENVNAAVADAAVAAMKASANRIGAIFSERAQLSLERTQTQTRELVEGTEWNGEILDCNTS